MIKLRKKNIKKILRQKLNASQALIDALPTYAEKVEAASDAWKKKNKSTFQAIRRILEKMCPGVHRCVYCEDARGDDIEHFHPKYFYPESTFVWKNYLLACSVCNSNYKRDKFAIVDETGQRHDLQRVKNAPVIAPPKGKPLLINPRYENPMDYLQIDIARTFHVKPRPNLTDFDHERAQYTIKIFQLNTRPELPKWREDAFGNFIGWIDTYAVHKANGNNQAIEAHKRDLANKLHLSIWEEMRHVYQNRGSNWGHLIKRLPRLQAIERCFSTHPELLSISFIL